MESLEMCSVIKSYSLDELEAHSQIYTVETNFTYKCDAVWLTCVSGMMGLASGLER